MAHYVIGLDYGSLSARGVLFDCRDGRALARATFAYPHGIMDRALPGGQALPPDYALQHPQDYLDALDHIIPRLLSESGLRGSEVIALGLDMTASSVLPLDREGQPLCLQAAWQDQPQAYVKMWKHQSAQPQADRMTALAKEWGENWLADYGGIISSTWLHPKLLELYEQEPALCGAADLYMEGADWLVYRLTGQISRNACAAGYKALYAAGRGYPEAGYFEALSPGFAAAQQRLLRGPVLKPGGAAGALLPDVAERLGLHPHCVVAAGMVDAHVGMVASGVTRPGVMHSILGTSGCHLTLGQKRLPVPGICGAVEDGILPGLWGYEAGQVCFGDHLDWLLTELLPPHIHDEARSRGLDLHSLMSEKAGRLLPGESGLLALDWWNGNRSVLVDSRLTGLLIGLNLHSSAADIYRALLEGLALSARLILDNFRSHGLPIDTLTASGGISQKNPLAMQIYADALGLPLFVPEAPEGAALGSAMLAAAAAGKARGGHDDVYEAIRHMAPKAGRHYKPNPDDIPLYEALYQEYAALHDYFGRGQNDVMKRLLALKEQASRRSVDA